MIGAAGTVLGLGWRVYAWRHGRATHLEVTVHNSFPFFAGELRDGFGLTAVNRSSHPIRVTSAGFVMPDGQDLVIMQPPFAGALPAEIPPHDSAQTLIERDELERAGFDVYGPVTGWVRTSTQERFESNPRVLRSPD